jgi:hypothetical protein
MGCGGGRGGGTLGEEGVAGGVVEWGTQQARRHGYRGQHIPRPLSQPTRRGNAADGVLRMSTAAQVGGDDVSDPASFATAVVASCACPSAFPNRETRPQAKSPERVLFRECLCQSVLKECGVVWQKNLAHLRRRRRRGGATRAMSQIENARIDGLL